MDSMLDSVSGKTNKAGTSGESTDRPTRKEAEAAVRTLLRYIGDDPDREGLLDTPKRVVKSFDEFYGGYKQDVTDHLERTFEEVGGYQDMIMVRDIPFYSHCEHHMVPFIGKAHIAYYPSAGVVGLSKLARVVDIFAHRLQTQEHLTAQIVNAITDNLAPRGLAVLLEAEHQCMTLRGVQKAGVSTITTKFTGIFEDNATEQARFMMLVRDVRA